MKNAPSSTSLSVRRTLRSKHGRGIAFVGAALGTAIVVLIGLPLAVAVQIELRARRAFAALAARGTGARLVSELRSA